VELTARHYSNLLSSLGFAACITVTSVLWLKSMFSASFVPLMSEHASLHPCQSFGRKRADTLPFRDPDGEGKGKDNARGHHPQHRKGRAHPAVPRSRAQVSLYLLLLWSNALAKSALTFWSPAIVICRCSSVHCGRVKSLQKGDCPSRPAL
jgi:hypothetical protein